jgi:serine/threonine-protein kinase HipA
MSIAGKREDVTREDLLGVAKANTIKKGAAIVDTVVETVARWMEFGAKAKVETAMAERIHRAQRRV